MLPRDQVIQGSWRTLGMIEALRPNVTPIRAWCLDGAAQFKTLGPENWQSRRLLTSDRMLQRQEDQIAAVGFRAPGRAAESAMKASAGKQSERVPWYSWPLVPLALPIGLVIMLPLGVLSLLSIAFYMVFPDTHPHKYDALGTPRQKELLASWRAHYARIGLRRRIKRSVKLWRRGREWRRRRKAAVRLSASHRRSDPRHPLWDQVVDE